MQIHDKWNEVKYRYDNIDRFHQVQGERIDNKRDILYQNAQW